MSSTQSHPLKHFECQPINKGFTQVAETFVSKGWSIKTNTPTTIIFGRPEDPRLVYDEIKLIAESDKVNVVIPMPNSNVAYCTWFKDYFSASEYMTSRLEDYCNAMSLTDLPSQKQDEED